MDELVENINDHCNINATSFRLSLVPLFCIVLVFLNFLCTSFCYVRLVRQTFFVLPIVIFYLFFTVFLVPCFLIYYFNFWVFFGIWIFYVTVELHDFPDTLLLYMHNLMFNFPYNFFDTLFYRFFLIIISNHHYTTTLHLIFTIRIKQINRINFPNYNQWQKLWKKRLFGQLLVSTPFPLLTMLRNNEQNLRQAMLWILNIVQRERGFFKQTF